MPAARKKGGPGSAVRKARTAVRDALAAAQDTVQARVGSARGQAGETWDAIESLFRSRVRKTLAELGVPGGDEIRQLTRRVAELDDAVEALTGRLGLPRAQVRARKRPAGVRRKGAATGRSRSAAKRKPRRAAR